MSIKQKIIKLVGRHRLLFLSLFVAFLLPLATNAAGDVQIRMVSDGERYLKNTVTGRYMTANRMLGPNGETYFCVSKGLRGPDYLVGRGDYGSFSSPSKMGEMSKKVLMLGYPNREIDGFNDTEQYHITQNAFWATTAYYDTDRAPEMEYNTIDNLRAVGSKSRNKAILQAVKDLYAEAEATNVAQFNPSVSLNAPSKATLQGNNIVAGPFNVVGKNLRSASFNLSASGANNVRFYNANNQTITTVGLDENFFISWPKDGNAASGTVKVALNGTARYLEGLIYKAPSYEMQDMATLALVDNPFNLSASATWQVPVIPDTPIQIKKIDATTKAGLRGAKIEVYNADNARIFAGTTGANGTVEVGKLKAGKYTYKEVEQPNGYYRNDKIHTFTINPGDGLKVLTIENTPIAKVTVCDLASGTIITIEETKFNATKHSKQQSDCAKLRVCDLESKKVIDIIASRNDPAKYSRNLDDCNAKIEVCELATKKTVTIDETKFDATKHSKNLEDCVPKIEVCDLNTKQIVTIREADFDSTKYSKKIADCVSTPPELPKTGPLETAAALIAITAVTLSVAYWYKSAQAVRQIKR